MKVISITGGVGSGKSELLKILERDFGAKALVADKIAHQLMEPGEAGYLRVTKALGTGFLNQDGTINRAVLANVIFRDKKALDLVNGIIHPMVWDYIRETAAREGTGLLVVEAALFDEEQNSLFDEIWYVAVSEEKRIERLLKARGYTREKAMAIMRNQPSEEEFKAHADFVIDNNGSMEEAVRQIKEILKKDR